MKKYKSSAYGLLKIVISCISLIVVLNLMYVRVSYGTLERKNVLLINSYNQSFINNLDNIEGIQSEFKDHNINLDVEYMDSKRFATKENSNNFYNSLKYKLYNLKPYDAIIVCDDSALQFAIDYHEDLFSNIPVVFMGINDLKRAEYAYNIEHMTGIFEEAPIKQNIEIARKFNKDAKKVVAIIDNTITGLGDKKQFYSIKNDYKDLNFEHIDVSEQSFEELCIMLEHIESDTILLYLSMFTDKSGKSIDIIDTFDILKEHTHVPVYRPFAGGVGQGLLGGQMISYYDTGKLAADMVIDILDDIPIESIQMIYDTPKQYYFDYNIIKKYNINEWLIPKESVIINKPSNFYEQNKNIILISFSIIIVLMIMTLLLIIDNINRRKIEKDLIISNKKLGETYDELAQSEEKLRLQYHTIQENIEEIKKLNEKYKLAIDSTNSAVWEIQVDSGKVYISKNFVESMELTDEELDDVYKLLEKIFTSKYKEKILNEYNKYKSGFKNEINIEVPIKIDNDSSKWVLINGKGVLDSGGKLNILHGIILDITKMKEQKEHIEYLAQHDYLTNLPNRMNFLSRLNHEIDSGSCGAVMMLDIDNFKGINDTLGHAYGDEVLKEISKRLCTITDDKLFISRFGGDEFLVLVSSTDSLEEIEKYAEKIKNLFVESFSIDNIDNYIQFSMGITRFPHDSINIYQLIANADTAMYNAKHSGKNTIQLFNREMKEELTNKAEIEYILRDALKNDGFILFYQPQVDVKTGNIKCFEALVRLKEFSITPDKFIPVAEESGLIVDIGRWVTKEAIEQLSIWRKKGFDLKPVAINFSSRQLSDNNYIDYIEKLLIENSIETKYFEMEITESILLEKTAKTEEFLNRLKTMGIIISLDDFGTGFSSLNYLTYIPVNKIKLDKFLCNNFLELNNINVLGNIISLAHSLNLTIIAEGIETYEQYKSLKIAGCDYIQGYLFSKPLISCEIEKIYDSNLLDGMNM